MSNISLVTSCFFVRETYGPIHAEGIQDELDPLPDLESRAYVLVDCEQKTVSLSMKPLLVAVFL